MLRINLLPAYIAEQRKVRLAIVVNALLFAIVTGALLAYVFLSLNPQLKQMQDDDAAETQKANDEQAYESQTATIQSQIAPLLAKVNFVDQVQFHNTVRQKIYRKAAKYTYRNVEYNSMSVTGNILALGANVSSLDDIGRFYISMFGNPDVTGVSFVGVPTRTGYLKAQPIITPGGAPPAPPQYFIAMNATLTHSVAAPTLPASMATAPGGTAGAAAPGIGGGSPGMMPPPSGGMAPPSGAPPAGGSGAPGSGAPGPMGSAGGDRRG